MLIPALIKAAIFCAIGWVIYKLVKPEPIRTICFIGLAILVIIWLIQLGGIHVP